MSNRKALFIAAAVYALCGIASWGHEMQRDPCPMRSETDGTCSRNGVIFDAMFAAVFWPLHLSSALWSKS